MNTPNPLIPQGSLQEQSKKKSKVTLIVFSILAVHVLFFGVLLIQGCKRDEPSSEGKIETPVPALTTSNEFTAPPVPAPAPASNLTAIPAMPSPSNPPAAPVGPSPGTTIEPPADVPKEHIIAKGETFAVLAKKYGVSVKAIQQANPGVDPTKLKLNQKIVIPAKPPANALNPTASGVRSPEPEAAAGETIYTVKKGDNLATIARNHGVKVKAIRAANKDLRTDQLKVGQKLKIPAKAASAPVASPATPPAPVTVPPTSAPATPLAQ